MGVWKHWTGWQVYFFDVSFTRTLKLSLHGKILYIIDCIKQVYYCKSATFVLALAELNTWSFSESSFNMTRGRGGGGWRYWRGRLQKFLDTGKGDSENLYTSKRTGGWEAPKKLNHWRGGLLKYQAPSFNIFIPPVVILNELSLRTVFFTMVVVAPTKEIPSTSVGLC